MLVPVAAAEQDPNPIPGLVLLALLVCGSYWLLRIHRRHKRTVAEARAAGLDLSEIPGARKRLQHQLRRLWIPAFVLMFLAPFCAEGLTGATPPQFFFFPVVLVFFVLFYGSGAILIREAALSWQKGWPTIVVLGAAYAILEEGLATKVFFDPDRTELYPDMTYGTWGGVHWPLTIFLVVFHAVFAIAIPIFLTTLLFPAAAAKPWVPRRALPIFGASLTACVLFSALVLHRYNPTPLHYLIAVGSILLLIALAWRLPTSMSLGRHRIAASPRCLALFGFWSTFIFWTMSFLFVAWHVPAAITLVAEMMIIIVCGGFLLRVGANDYGWFGLAGGMLGFFVFTSFVLTALGSVLQIFVGIGSWYALLSLGRHLRARAHSLGDDNMPRAGSQG